MVENSDFSTIFYLKSVHFVSALIAKQSFGRNYISAIAATLCHRCVFARD